jgi:hypothetical protein
LALPVHFRYGYQFKVIQSTYLFEQKVSFILLFYTWVLFCLLSLRGSIRGEFHRLTAVMAYAVVFLGWWSLISPSRTLDGLLNLTTVRHISSTGALEAGLALPYYEFPGSHIFAGILAQVGALDVFPAASIALIFNSLSLSALLYCWFRRCLGAPPLSAIAALTTIQGSWILARLNIFYPGYFALSLFATFLIFLSNSGRSYGGGRSGTLAMVILVIAATAIHFVTALSLFFLLLGRSIFSSIGLRSLHVLGRVPLRRIFGSQSATEARLLLAIALIIPLGWVLFRVPAVLDLVARQMGASVHNVAGLGFLNSAQGVASANLSPTIPLWARTIRVFWLTLVYGVGVVLFARLIVRGKKLCREEQLEVGGLLGILIMSAVSLVVAERGTQYYRFLMYGMFFTLPLILRPVWRLTRSSKSLSMALLGGFWILSLPTFFAHNDRIIIDAWNSEEFAAGRFLQSSRSGTRLHIFSIGSTLVPFQFYMPEVKHTEEFWPRDEQDAWRQLGATVQAFEETMDDAVFPFSPRPKGIYLRDFMINPNDSRWVALERKLATTNRIYDSRWVELFAK